MCFVNLINVLEHAVRGSYAKYLMPIMMVSVMFGSNSKKFIIYLRMHIQFRY